jgi:RND family efflux transporter MFP subunit
MNMIIALAALAPLAIGASACGKNAEGQAKLPPATGEGAPPLPELPKLDKPATAGGSAIADDQRTTGSLFPRAEAQIAPNTSGVIVSLKLSENDRVKKGDVLFRIDSRDAILRRDQAAAALKAAQVNLAATQVEYDRTKTLFEQNAVNKAAWDAIVARMDGARVGIEQAKVALAMANKAIADATVKAPFDGVISQKLKNEGEYVSMMPPAPVVVLQDQSKLDLKFRMPEKVLATVKAGRTITARFEAVNVTRDATIVRINPTVDPRSRTVEMVAELDNADGSLRPGFFAHVTLNDAAGDQKKAGGK